MRKLELINQIHNQTGIHKVDILVILETCFGS